MRCASSGGNSVSREQRKALIEAIENKRDSKVIAYVTSDRRGLEVQIAGDVVPVLHEHILAIPEAERSKLDLFLYSRGGHGDVPWSIVSMFREYCQEGSFSVLIPYRAHSAATVIALAADEIVMTKKSELSPIDITLVGPYSEKDEDTKQRLPISVEDVKGYFSLLEKVGCKRTDEKMNAFELLTDRVHSLALGRVYRALQETELVALRLLSTRATPFSEEDNRKIVEKISSEIYSHEHAISRTEAVEYVGLKQINNAEAEDIQIADELWNLYEQYKVLFHLEEPFTPEEHLVTNDLEEDVWTDLNLACVESLHRVDICKQSMRVRRLRQVPPQVQLNLTNLSVPIALPSLPAGANQQQINALVGQVVSTVVPQSLGNAAQVAAQELMKALPQAGFERFIFGAGWKEEGSDED
ncbi:MAG: hypothetical protein CEE40_11570 [Chloroflexi bacterium B3_Chlor]|nr:MAG: hypothetical protein CEE40_11570 [Chloroflexi bacterium B3_Chlor]